MSTYHYNGPAGQFQGITAEQVVNCVRSAPGNHYVWAQGMSGWMLAEQVQAIAALLAPPAAPQAPAYAAPPASPQAGGYGPSAAVDGDPMSVYREELEKLNHLSEREGGGSEFDWWAPGKPASMGQSIMSPFRLLPMPFVDATGSPVIDPRTGLPQRAKKFWTRATRHQVKMPDGTSKSFVCLDDHDDANAVKRCPLCALSRALYDTRDKGLGEFAREIRAQHRCYANIIDLNNVQTHWEKVTQPDGSQGYRVRSKVWGFSKQLHQKLMQIAVAKSCFLEDPQHGRNLVLICNRIGKAQRDIRYDITDADASALAHELYPILQGSHNLDVLANPSTVEELAQVAAEVDPRPRHMRGGTYTPGAPQGAAPQGYSQPPQGFPQAAPQGYGQPPANTPTPGYGAPPPSAPAYAAPPPQAAPPAGSYAPVQHAAAPPAAAPSGPPAGFPPPQAAPPVPSVRYKYHGPAGTVDGLSPDDVAQRVTSGPGPHYVWTEGMTQWADVEQVPGLAQAIAARRAPPPASVAPPVVAPPPAAPAAPPSAPMPPSAPPQAAPPAAPPMAPSAPPAGPPVGGPPSGPPAGPPGGPPQPPGAPGAW